MVPPYTSLHPPRRHHAPARLALDLAPPIALVGRQQNHLLALLHGCFALAARIIRVKSLDVADFLGAAAGSDGWALLAACARVDATCERGGGH
jgi:hypothetical protein